MKKLCIVLLIVILLPIFAINTFATDSGFTKEMFFESSFYTSLSDTVKGIVHTNISNDDYFYSSSGDIYVPKNIVTDTTITSGIYNTTYNYWQITYSNNKNDENFYAFKIIDGAVTTFNGSGKIDKSTTFMSNGFGEYTFSITYKPSYENITVTSTNVDSGFFTLPPTLAEVILNSIGNLMNLFGNNLTLLLPIALAIFAALLLPSLIPRITRFFL